MALLARGISTHENYGISEQACFSASERISSQDDRTHRLWNIQRIIVRVAALDVSHEKQPCTGDAPVQGAHGSTFFAGLQAVQVLGRL